MQNYNVSNFLRFDYRKQEFDHWEDRSKNPWELRLYPEGRTENQFPYAVHPGLRRVIIPLVRDARGDLCYKLLLRTPEQGGLKSVTGADELLDPRRLQRLNRARADRLLQDVDCCLALVGQMVSPSPDDLVVLDYENGIYLGVTDHYHFLPDTYRRGGLEAWLQMLRSQILGIREEHRSPDRLAGMGQAAPAPADPLLTLRNPAAPAAAAGNTWTPVSRLLRRAPLTPADPLLQRNAAPAPARQTPAAPAAWQTPRQTTAVQTPAAPVSQRTTAAPATRQTPAAPAARQTPAAPSAPAVPPPEERFVLTFPLQPGAVRTARLREASGKPGKPVRLHCWPRVHQPRIQALMESGLSVCRRLMAVPGPGGCVITAAGLPQAACLSLADPAFHTLTPAQRLTAARHALAALLEPLARGWCLACLDDDSLQIGTETFRAVLAEPEWLVREGDDVPLVGGLGCVPAERLGKPARQADTAWGGAVWLLRLLTGAFPWQSLEAGRRLEAESLTEEDLAEEYLRGTLPFAFDPAGNQHPWEPRCEEAWQTLPAAVRDWFLARFRSPRPERFTPADLEELKPALGEEPG